MADERKKRLEEIRKRKEMLAKMMADTKAQSTPNPAIPVKIADSSTHVETSSSESSSISMSTNPSFKAPRKSTSIKNEIIYNIQKKKLNESLRPSKSEHYIRGIPKNRKSEE